MSQPVGDMVQIHALTAYPAALLNRDDAGLAKRVPFGGVTRTRVSSQCLKKHWRDAPMIKDMGDTAIRSRGVYERLVAKPLIVAGEASEAEAVSVARWLMQKTVATKPVPGKESGLESAQSSQLLVLTQAETTHLLDLAREAVRTLRDTAIEVAPGDDVGKHLDGIVPKDWRDKLQRMPASIDTALFGRMVTSDLFARVDAAVSVAHAFTTHREASETDYFTAVDTLKGDADDAGAGLIQETELTSGVYYLYVVIDMVQLRKNLVAQDAALSERLASNLVRAIATVSPGAKRGSTAPYAYAEFVMTERGPAQPRTLANAFLKPVSATGAGLMAASVESLLGHRGRLERMYGSDGATTSVATIHDVEGLEAVALPRLLAATFTGAS